jgi:hypothetical protein
MRDPPRKEAFLEKVVLPLRVASFSKWIRTNSDKPPCGVAQNVDEMAG